MLAQAYISEYIQTPMTRWLVSNSFLSPRDIHPVAQENNVRDILAKSVLCTHKNCIVEAIFYCAFDKLSESRFLFDALHRSKFANFCNDLMQNHLS